jgi:hypothetical protein
MFYFVQFISFFILSFILFFVFKIFLKERLTCFYISFFSSMIMFFVSLNDINARFSGLKYFGFKLSQGSFNDNSMSYELLARFSGLILGLLFAVIIAFILKILFKNRLPDKNHNNIEQLD